MFILAGFNGTCRTRGIAFAKVSRLDRRWVRRAELLRFACGDFAWYGPGGISWGEQLRIVPFYRVPQPTVPKTCRVRP